MKKLMCILFISTLTVAKPLNLGWTNVQTNSASGQSSTDYSSMTKQQLLALKAQINAQLSQYNNMLAEYMNQIYLHQNPTFSQQQIANTQSQISSLNAQTDDINDHLNNGTYRQSSSTRE